MTPAALTDWLLAEGGAIIRYLTATELLGSLDAKEETRLRRELLACPEVERWLDNLAAVPGERPRIHGSRDTDAENAMGKLLEYGLRRGMRAFDERMRPYLELITPDMDPVRDLVPGPMLAPLLIRAGYADNERVAAFFTARLRALAATAKRGSYDLILSKTGRRALPQRWCGKPIYRPEFYEQFPLPTIYDWYALAYLPVEGPETRRMVRDVAAYVSDTRFQATPSGYLWDREKGRFRAAGRVWLAILPTEEPAGTQHTLTYPGRFVLFLAHLPQLRHVMAVFSSE